MVVGLWKETWLQLFTILTQIDFDEMDAKCDSSQYRIAEEFRADAQLIVHNIVIFHGGKDLQTDQCCVPCFAITDGDLNYDKIFMQDWHH